MQTSGTRLSENISRREPEGYLLCLNVPVARTGSQEYLPAELGLPADSPGGLIPVFRPEEEVFSPETVASFEGMPVTNDHPPDGVDIENIRRLQAGHAHNVRRGAGAEADLLLADLIITDPVLIDAVLAGKREISCGYNYELHEENGRYVQRRIRGNHIAVVEAGRAGRRVSIRDARCSGRSRGISSRCHPERNRGISPSVSTDCSERSNTIMKKNLTKVLARLARDGDAETVAEFIGEMIGETPEEPAPEAAPDAGAESAETVTVEVPEGREITVDCESFSALLEKMDRLIELLAGALAAPPVPGTDGDGEAGEIAEAVEEAVEAAQQEGEVPAEEIADLVETILEGEGSVTLEEKESDCADPDTARDALRAALLAVRPALKSLSPRQRRKIGADIAANLRERRKGADRNVYAALAAGRRAPANLSALGERIMAARNPNYRAR